MAEYRPTLGEDPYASTATLTEILTTNEPGVLVLPAGRHDIAGGVELSDGWSVTGAGRDGSGRPLTTLAQAATDERPLVHMTGSHTRVSDLGFELRPAEPRGNDGDRWTAITAGQYMYDAHGPEPTWIENIGIEGISVTRDDGRTEANTVAVMGAVRNATVTDLHVDGGGTGLAVHWGARGNGVADVRAPTVHPHDIEVQGLRVNNTSHGFYLSGVHNTSVRNAELTNVGMGFRLLAGNNGDSLHPDRLAGRDSPVSSNVSVRDCRITWDGDGRAVFATGDGVSKMRDGVVNQLPFRSAVLENVTVEPLSLRGDGTDERFGIVLRNAGDVQLHGVTVIPHHGVVPLQVDGQEIPLPSSYALPG